MQLALAEAVAASGSGSGPVVGVSVARVDAVQLSPEAAQRIAWWLARFAELAGEFGPVAPGDIREVQYALAECCVTTQSRNRDGLPGRVVAPIPLCHDESGGGVVSVTTAARALGVKPDTVRKWCRDGKLDAVRHGSRWFPKAAAVQELQWQLGV
jgi:excisionase family DNA binding protein